METITKPRQTNKFEVSNFQCSSIWYAKKRAPVTKDIHHGKVVEAKTTEPISLGQEAK